jgi:acyl-CoA hydrolase
MEQEQPRMSASNTSQGRSIAYSRSMTTRMMQAMDANVLGNVHGGVIMRMVDEAAAIVAVKHARLHVVTGRVERFDFLAPAYIGNVVSVHCEMNYVGRASMEVGVEVMAEDLMTGETRLIAHSHVIYIALGKDGRPAAVPPLVPADAGEQEKIERARLRRMRIRAIEEELAKIQADHGEV